MINQKETRIPDAVRGTICELANTILELRDKINQLQTFKDCARCFYDECDNKAEHSDGHRLWCSDCWDAIEEVA